MMKESPLMIKSKAFALAVGQAIDLSSTSSTQKEPPVGGDSFLYVFFAVLADAMQAHQSSPAKESSTSLKAP